jgi:hypothetical protein
MHVNTVERCVSGTCCVLLAMLLLGRLVSSQTHQVGCLAVNRHGPDALFASDKNMPPGITREQPKRPQEVLAVLAVFVDVAKHAPRSPDPPLLSCTMLPPPPISPPFHPSQTVVPRHCVFSPGPRSLDPSCAALCPPPPPTPVPPFHPQIVVPWRLRKMVNASRI